MTSPTFWFETGSYHISGILLSVLALLVFSTVKPLRNAFIGLIFEPLDWFLVFLAGTKPATYLTGDPNEELRRKAVKQNGALQGAFAPTHEEYYAPQLPTISGEIPKDLKGIYMKNSPNPQILGKAGHHWFDGDGMIHVVKLENGQATYMNRQTRTKRLTEELKVNRPLAMRIGDLVGRVGLVRLLLHRFAQKLGYLLQEVDPLKSGSANTALMHHSDKTYALMETNLPLEVEVVEHSLKNTTGAVVDRGSKVMVNRDINARILRRSQDDLFPLDIRTGSYQTFGGKLKHACAAHPKIDHRTGELFMFSINTDFGKTPTSVFYSVLNENRDIIESVELKDEDVLQRPVMLHDCVITENHIVIPYLPLFMDGKRMIHGKSAFVYEGKTTAAKYGVVERRRKNHGSDAKKNIQWFTLPGHFIFHYANAFEDGPTKLVLYGCLYDDIQLDDVWEQIPDIKFVKIVLDLASGELSEYNTSLIPEYSVEFPKIDEKLTGYKNRYVYMPCRDIQSSIVDFVGFLKYDVQENKVVRRISLDKTQNESCTEMQFQARIGQKTEDDGYVMGFITKDKGSSPSKNDGRVELESDFGIWDAQTFEEVARIRLPARVPTGFHGIFVE